MSLNGRNKIAFEENIILMLSLLYSCASTNYKPLSSFCIYRVIGVQRLRVINAAVMPKIPTGNTNTPTEMIAEKIYDVMKNDIQCHEPPYAEWKTNRDQKPYFNSDDTPFPRE